MTKAGPSIMRWALYQASQIERRFDPQLASVYHREMVHNGKNHKQAMGAVMSHIGARVLTVLQENRPYELRDNQDNHITWEEARKLVLANYQVPEEIKQARRRRTTEDNSAKLRKKQREIAIHSTHEATEAPQPVVTTASPR